MIQNEKVMVSKTISIRIAQGGPLAILLFMFLTSSLLVPNFFSFTNITNILHQAAVYIIMAIGMTFVITGGGIDLSIGSQIALNSVITSAFILRNGWPVWAAILFSIFFGAFLGAINGFVIAKFHVPDFIMTLATMEIYRGLALVHSAGIIWFNFPKSFGLLGQMRVSGIPVAFMIAFAIAMIGLFIYRSTFLGRYTIAIGGNTNAAMLAGVPVFMYKMLQYVFLGSLTALASVLLTSRLNSSQATMATGYEIHVIAAVIIGGTYLFGGRGNVVGSVVGALILALIANTMVLLGIDYFWRLVATGFVILLAVALNMWQEKVIRESA